MMQDAKLSAAGRKGEEAIDVDVSTMLPGDWLTIITEEGSMKLTRYGDGEYRLTGITYGEAADGESYLEAGVAFDPKGNEPGFTRLAFRRKRDPAADARKAGRGEFTA